MTKRLWTATNTAGYTAPAALAVDVVLLTVHRDDLQILLLRDPARRWVLPGGFVGETETAAETASRKLEEKTGLTGIYLEQLGAFTEPNRDPRGWIPSIAYLALVPPATEPLDGRGTWAPAFKPPQLGYDHNLILATAIDRVRGKLWWSNIAAGILAQPFTLAHARGVYEAIAQESYDPSTFARDLKTTGLIEETGQVERSTGGRPAVLYRFRARTELQWGHGHKKRVAGP